MTRPNLKVIYFAILVNESMFFLEMQYPHVNYKQQMQQNLNRLSSFIGTKSDSEDSPIRFEISINIAHILDILPRLILSTSHGLFIMLLARPLYKIIL